MTHPVDRLSDGELYELLMTVNAEGFPADIEQLWRVEKCRYRETLRRIPPAGSPRAALLDLGSSRPWFPFFTELLGYRRLVLNTAYPESGMVDPRLVADAPGPLDVSMSVFDVECDPFPYPDNAFDVITCLEVLEHLAIDPMAMLSEINRVLKPGGVFVLSTPNAIRYSNVVKILLGEQPLGWTPYNGMDSNRHNREYAPGEVTKLFEAAGITPHEVTTFGAKRRGLRREALKRLVAAGLFALRSCPGSWRRDVILVAGKKTSPVVDRRPPWLYFEAAEYVNAAKRRVHKQRKVATIAEDEVQTTLLRAGAATATHARGIFSAVTDTTRAQAR